MPHPNLLTNPLLEPPTITTTSTTSSTTSRLKSIDILRGIIMLVMSWDHSRDFLSQHKVASHGSERWSGPLSTYDNNAAVLFQRWISHFCAPGFFFTMGLGMYFMATSRMKKYQWTNCTIINHFLLRGFILLVVGRLVDMAIAPEIAIITAHNQSLFPNNPHHSSASSSPFHGPQWLAPFLGIFEVMTALGLTMQTVGVLVPTILYLERIKTSLGQLLSIVFGVISIALSTFYILKAQDGDPCGPLCHASNSNGTVFFPRFAANADTLYEIVLRFLLYPGAFSYGDIIYPLIPWCSLTFFGFAAGILYKRNSVKAFKLTGIFGVISLLLFLILRFFGGAKSGNLRGWPRNEGSSVKWIAFLTVCKYPPSVSYILLTLGGNWCLLYIIERFASVKADGRIEKILLVYGQAPLFFYTIHFWVLGCVGFFVRMFASGMPIEFVTIPWLIMIVCLWWPCEWWRRKKQCAQHDSWLKLF